MKAVLTLLALLASSSALAQPVMIVADSPTAHVGFADLDLTSDAGVQTLQARIRATARDLCDDAIGPQPVNVQFEHKACFDAAYADGIRQADLIVSSRRAEMASAARGRPIGGK